MLNKLFKVFKYKNNFKFFKTNQKIISQEYVIKRILKKIKIIICCFILFWILMFNKKANIKIALCTMGKNENLYVKEFINYYLKLGVDKIIIYDDYDFNSEKISDMIDSQYRKFVKIYEAKKINIPNQSIAFSDCYEKYSSIFDWIIMIDMDEFLYIKNDRLKNYLLNPVFNKCDFIKIHWVIPTDNNHLYYENKPLFERFKGPYINSIFIKSIIRGNIPRLKYWVHSPYISPVRNITCNNKGEIINYKNLNFEIINKIDISKAFIIHFKYKSTEETIKKIKRGYSNWFGTKKMLKLVLRTKIKSYLTNNQITKEKLKYLEKELHINLSKYKKFCK